MFKFLREMEVGDVFQYYDYPQTYTYVCVYQPGVPPGSYDSEAAFHSIHVQLMNNGIPCGRTTVFADWDEAGIKVIGHIAVKEDPNHE